MSEQDLSTIDKSEPIYLPNFDKRVSFKFIQIILGSSASYITFNNIGLVNLNSDKLPNGYPNSKDIVLYRQQFTMILSIVCISYAALLAIFFLVLKSSDISEEEDSLEVELRKRRYLRTNMIITKASIIADMLCMVLWVCTSSGFLFPINSNDVTLDIKSISCRAANDSHVSNQRPWREVCNGCLSLVLIGYTLCVAYLFSGVYSLLYLSKNNRTAKQ
eukprot:NODE_19_length_39463_cov_0.396073.p18 type:complete len:218 gc:universal NODE_19_length_39463_cov_0.396073:24899-24246(-)